VLIELGDGENDWGTVGVSENIVEASWKALVDSIDYKLLKDEAENIVEASWKALVDSIDYKLLKDEAKRVEKAMG